MLTYTAHASVGGKLAQIGQRLIDGAAKQIADDFFGRFTHALTPRPIPSRSWSPIRKSMPRRLRSPSSNARRARRLAPEIWVVGLIGVVAILLLIFGVVL